MRVRPWQIEILRCAQNDRGALERALRHRGLLKA